MLLEARHRVIEKRIGRFFARKPDPRLGLARFACQEPDLSTARSFVKGFVKAPDLLQQPIVQPACPAPPVPAKTPASASGTDAGGNERRECLRKGDWLHITVISPADGYLQLLNLGASRDIIILYPDTPQVARQIQVGVKQFVL